MLVEVCANSLQSALNAEKGGADRIELCSELAVGGITPSYGLMKSIKKKLSIPVHVLIRPRSGDFSYSDEEFNIMKTNIELCVELGFDGIVSGVLHEDFTLDKKRTKALIELSGNLKFTFHRAFDWLENPMTALSYLETLGVDYILTSGQKKTALKGIELLTELHRKASRTTIMPGGGIRTDNIHLFQEAGFAVVHLSGTKLIKTLSSKPKVSMNSPSFLSDDELALTDTDTIHKIVNGVK